MTHLIMNLLLSLSGGVVTYLALRAVASNLELERKTAKVTK